MPRTRSRHATRISRRSPPGETRTGNVARHNLKKPDVCLGCIVWLPPKVESDESLVCGRGKTCCNGQKLGDGGYNHPVVIVCYEGNTCYIAVITSKNQQETNSSKRIPISQKPPDVGDLDVESKLYLEMGEMHKQSFIIIDHLFPISLSMLRCISLKTDSRAFDKRLLKQSYLDLIDMFGIDKDRVKWVDTVIVKAKDRNVTGGRGQRVTFQDPWEEMRGNISATHHTRKSSRRSQRAYSEPTPAATTTLPSTRLPPAQTKVPTPPIREWHTPDRGKSRSMLRDRTTERQALLQHPSPLFPQYDPPPLLRVQPTWHHQPHIPRSNYQAALPSVERYDRAHWDARIRHANTRARDVERGRDGDWGGNGEGEESCDGGLYGKLVVLLLGIGGLVWWFYGR